MPEYSVFFDVIGTTIFLIAMGVSYFILYRSNKRLAASNLEMAKGLDNLAGIGLSNLLKLAAVAIVIEESSDAIKKAEARGEQGAANEAVSSIRNIIKMGVTSK
jgi:hypothetical protein